MKEVFILLVVVSLLFLGCGEDELIGGDKDEYGCLSAAGYTWCEGMQKCLRTWEEECVEHECLSYCKEELYEECVGYWQIEGEFPNCLCNYVCNENI